MLSRIGGTLAGIALTVTVYHLLETRVSLGLPGRWLLVATGLSAMGYILASRVRPVHWRTCWRSASTVALIVWAALTFVGWTGHLGGYDEGRQMRNWLIAFRGNQAGALTSSGALVSGGLTEDTPTGLLRVAPTGEGWSAVLTHRRSGRACSIVIPSAPESPPSIEPRPTCAPRPISPIRLVLSGVMLLGGLLLVDRPAARGTSGR